MCDISFFMVALFHTTKDSNLRIFVVKMIIIDYPSLKKEKLKTATRPFQAFTRTLSFSLSHYPPFFTIKISLKKFD